jgi:hypothetical protein
MKCTFTEADFRPVWHAILPPGTTDLNEIEDRGFWDGVVRVQVADGALTVRSPFAEASCPADVETPGVLFIPFREFSELTDTNWGEPVFSSLAADETVATGFHRTLCQPWQFALFPDPATAPDSWTPPDEEPRDGCADDLGDDEYADGGVPTDQTGAADQLICPGHPQSDCT